MSIERMTDIMEMERLGSGFFSSHYNNNIDIASPLNILITTGAKKAQMTIRVKNTTAATTVIKTGVVIGTGGGASPGSVMGVVSRDMANTTAPLAAFGSDYILGSSGQSAGATILTEYNLANGEMILKLKLKAATVYGLIFTTIADNNIATFHFEFDEV